MIAIFVSLGVNFGLLSSGSTTLSSVYTNVITISTTYTNSTILYNNLFAHGETIGNWFWVSLVVPLVVLFAVSFYAIHKSDKEYDAEHKDDPDTREIQ